MKSLMIILIILVVIILAILVVPWWLNQKTPQPAFTLIKKDGPIELRQYDAMLLATTRVNDDRSASINTGFRRLAGYIFGRHQAKDQGNIAMTAPVIQKKSSNDNASNIAMTAPVIQSPLGGPDNDSQAWEIAFVMPKQFDETTIPQPMDKSITLVSQQPQQLLTIRFTGRINQHKLDKKAHQLQQYAQQHQIAITGEPILAFYDPPWIFPWLKRHEIWFLVVSSQPGVD